MAERVRAPLPRDVDLRELAGHAPAVVWRLADRRLDQPHWGRAGLRQHPVFTLGTFLPLGSLIRITYDGGYTTVPADLERACKLQAAVLVLGEIDPAGTQFGHDPGALSKQAETILCRYQPT